MSRSRRRRTGGGADNVYVIPATKPQPLWTLTEVAVGDRTSISETFADPKVPDEAFAQVWRDLSLLRVSGCPPDRSRSTLIIEHLGKHRMERLDRDVHYWVLKCKPTTWRLYFYVVDRDARHIEFLFAVDKRTQKRDPEDAKRCIRILKKVDSGATQSKVIDIPSREA